MSVLKRPVLNPYSIVTTAMRTLITCDDYCDTDQPPVSELEVSAVCSVNNNNEMDALEKRRSFADMKMVNVTNSNYHSQVRDIVFSFHSNLIILNCQDLQDSASHSSSHSKLSNDSHSPDDCINFSSSELVSSEIETIIECIDTKYHNNIYLAMFSSAY